MTWDDWDPANDCLNCAGEIDPSVEGPFCSESCVKSHADEMRYWA